MFTHTENFRFAEFTLSPAKRTLFRERMEIKLRDKEFDVLAFLIESAPKTCSHDEIIENVWNGTFVENGSVEKAIANIRKILGDDIKNPRFIKTVRQKGYLFIGDIKFGELQESQATFSLANSNQTSRQPTKNYKFHKVLLSLAVLIFFASAGIYLAKSVFSAKPNFLLSDNFSNSEIDSNLWEAMLNLSGKIGSSGKIGDGILKLVVKETDNYPIIFSKYITIDPTKSVKVKSRMKITFAQNMKEKTYFGGVFGFIPKTEYLEKIPVHQDTDVENHLFFGLRYMNIDSDDKFTGYDGETIQGVPTEGFFIVKDGGRPSAKEEYADGKISPRIEPIWDKWFEQEIVYNPTDGQMIYFEDGEKKGEFNVSKLNAKDNQIRLYIMPWGWWVNHSMEIDYIEVTQ